MRNLIFHRVSSPSPLPSQNQADSLIWVCHLVSDFCYFTRSSCRSPPSLSPLLAFAVRPSPTLSSSVSGILPSFPSASLLLRYFPGFPFGAKLSLRLWFSFLINFVWLSFKFITQASFHHFILTIINPWKNCITQRRREKSNSRK